MFSRNQSHRVGIYLEEFGPMGIEADVDVVVYPGEPMVRYYADGSGYPGSPTEIEVRGVTVTEVCGYNYQLKRNERPDWFKDLDRLVLEHLECHIDDHYEYILEDLDGWID